MIRYVSGEDNFTARKRIAALAQEMHAQLRFVDEEDVARSSVEQLFDGSSGSLFGKTLLVLRDVSSYKEALREQLSIVCAAPEKYDAVLWDRVLPDKRTTFYKMLQKNLETEYFPIIHEKNKMAAWISQYAEELSGVKNTFESSAIDMLIQKVGYDTWTLSSEIQKLLAYHTPVNSEDVSRIVPEASTSIDSAFPLLDAIVAKRQKSAVDVLQNMIEGGSSERFIISMLAYQFRLFLATRLGADAAEGASAIAKQSKLHPIAIQKAIPIVRRLSVGIIQDILSRIALTERSMNTKSMDPRSMLTMLVIGLAA